MVQYSDAPCPKYGRWQFCSLPLSSHTKGSGSCICEGRPAPVDVPACACHLGPAPLTQYITKKQINHNRRTGRPLHD